MDNRTKKKVYARLAKAFCLGEQLSITNLQTLFDAENASTGKTSEKIADDFKVLCSKLEKKMMADHYSYIEERKISLDFDDILNDLEKSHYTDNVQEQKKKEKLYPETIDVFKDMEILQKLLPIDEINTLHYKILYAKTFMKWIAETDSINAADFGIFEMIMKNNTHTKTEPLYYLLVNLVRFFVYDNYDAIYEGLLDLQYLIRANIQQAVRGVLCKKETITDDVLERFQIYAQIIEFINLLKQPRLYITKNDIPYAISFINYCLAEAYVSADSRDKLMALEFAKGGLNILEPSLKQDAFYTLGYWATGVDIQLAYDSYYSWINRTVTGEIANQKLYTITPAFDDEDIKWRKAPESIKKEAEMRSNLAYTCSLIGDTYELGTQGRREFYKKAIDEIMKAIKIYLEATKRDKLDANASIYYRYYGSFLSAPINKSISQEKDIKNALEQYDLYLETAKEHQDTDEIVNAIYYSSLTIMDLLSCSFHHYVSSISKLNPISIFEDWINNKEDTAYYLERLVALSTEYKNNISKPQFGHKLEHINEQCLEIQDLMNMVDKYADDAELIKIVLLLILIRRATWHIRSRLCRLEYSNKGYYMTRHSNELLKQSLI